MFARTPRSAPARRGVVLLLLAVDRAQGLATGIVARHAMYRRAGTHQRTEARALFDFLTKLGGGPAEDMNMESAGLIPDVLQEPFEPSVDLQVKFPTWVRSALNLQDVRSFGDTPTRGAGLLEGRGQVITPTQAREPPTLLWDPAAASAAEGDPLGPAPEESLKFYSFAVVDADAPTPANPSARSWLHWLVVNVPGADVDDGEQVLPYIGPFPSKGGGAHRYFVVLMEQPAGQQSFPEPEAAVGSLEELYEREGFSVERFCDLNGLRPVGWHMFRADFDTYSMELRAELNKRPRRS